MEYTLKLAEAAASLYHLKWMEECLIPEDFDSHIELRKRLPWQTLTTGEHWPVLLMLSVSMGGEA